MTFLNKHIDGQTSTFIPGKQGPRGKRARVTFIASYSEGQSTDAKILEQYRLNENDLKIESLIKMSYQYHGQSDYPDYDCIDSSSRDYRDSSTIPICSCATDVSTSHDISIGCDDIISGDIIESEYWVDGETSEDSYPGYKFYERDVVKTDSSIAYTAKIPNSYISIIVPGFDTVPKLVRRLSEYPEEYDYIIYIDKNVTYLLMITKTEENEYYEPIACHCKILDTWKKSENIATYVANINDITDNIKMYHINYPITKIVTDDAKINKKLESANECEVYTKRIKDETKLKNFLIVSPSLKPIGDYKITVEFLYKKDQPFVDSLIAKLYSDGGYNNSVIGDSNNFVRGMNFDNEKLNTFDVIIKDYNDGKNELSFNSTQKFYIPEERWDDYVAYFYVYYKKLNGGYNKVLVNKMQYRDFINTSDDYNCLEEA